MIKLTSKERNYLRKKAHSIEAVVRIGKNGLSDTVLASIDDAITKQELIKIKLLNNTSETIDKGLVEKIEKYTNAITIYDIGHTIIMFKENKKGPITADFLNFRKSNK